jgi:hypothetical protein
VSLGPNKKLESLFNLPEVKQELDDSDNNEEQPSLEVKTLEAIDKIDQALPAIRGLESADSEMDEIAAAAMSSYRDLVDLGMQVESRAAAEVLAVAASFMGHAITAKTAKINKKLKMVELQLKKAKLDHDSAGAPEENSGTGAVFDRNELLEHLKKNLQ